MSPVNSLQSPRFCGIRTFMRQPAATAETPQTDISIIGVPFDSGVSYRPGTRFGPAAIREASTLLKPYCPELDVDVNEHFTIADHGDIDTIPGYMEDSFDTITSGLTPFFCLKNPARDSGRRPQHKPCQPARRARSHRACGPAAF